MTYRTCTLAALTLLACQSGFAQTPLFENSDFSQGNLDNWTPQGEAFQFTPTTAPINPGWDVTGSAEKDLKVRWDTQQSMYRQAVLTGYEGPFANSYHPKRLDKSRGSLESVPFVIRKPYIRFTLASGDFSFPGRLAVNLLVDGTVRRQATADSSDMRACCFDVREFQGKEARLVLVDQHRFHGGWLAADEFTAADSPGDSRVIDADAEKIVQASARVGLKATRRYLNIPAKDAVPGDAIKIWVDGRVVEERCMALSDAIHADHWQFIDLAQWRGEEIEVSFEGFSSSKEPLSGIALDDNIQGLDNVYAEPLRPQFHFTPKQGWSNDVNGTVYYDGEYHLFYQYDPSRIGQIGRNMHWGHAVSRDLFHWKELPIALGTDPERGQNYSGSAIVDFQNSAGLQQGSEKTLIAFYTRRDPYYLLVHDYGVDSSSQCMAYSLDRGLTWTHVDKPLIPCITTKNRDPKVFWHEESDQWIMVFFKTTGFVFFGSRDLWDWEELSEVDGYHECPDIFQLEVQGDPGRKKWVLVNGSGDYSLGDFDGKRFVAEYRGRADFGVISATQTFGQAPGGTKKRTQMAWLHVSPPEMPFKQLISLPMDLTLRDTAEGLRIFSNPAESITCLHGERVTVGERQLNSNQIGNQTVPWELFDATFSVELNDAEKFALEIRGISVQYDAKSGKLTIDNKKSQKNMPVVLPKNGRLNIRAILDRCTLDVVINDGQAHLVAEAYPDKKRPALQLTEGMPSAKLVDAEFIEMTSMWE